MRKLIYVPIIHISADLGEFSSEISKRGKSLTSEEGWKGHEKTLLGFWDSIDHYFERLEVKNLKIYQDGLVADEEMGQKIISEGKKKGSRNFEIVSKLINRGAQLVKTEDFSLVKKEYDYLMKILKSKKKIKKILDVLIYKFRKIKLLKERDEFIAQNINDTLKQGETGILFLGAEHEIVPRLSKDIEVVEIKKRERRIAFPFPQLAFASTSSVKYLRRETMSRTLVRKASSMTPVTTPSMKSVNDKYTS